MTTRARRCVLTVATLAAGLGGVRQASAQSDTMTTSFDVNGLKVVLRRNTSNDVIAANIYLLGGTQQLTPATQGIELMLLRAAEYGTKRYPGDLGRQIIARLGSVMTVAPAEDWTVYGFTSIRSTFDSTWAVFADRLVAPMLDSNQVEQVRARMLTAARAAATSPDPIVSQLADSLMFMGHPYGFSPEGNAATLQSITLAQLRHYQATQMVTSRMLLVVVGNLDQSALEQLVRGTLGQLPTGSYAWSPPHQPARLGRALVVRDAQLPTNYLLGYYAGPAATEADYPALRLATAILSGRFFTEIRSKRNLSYEVDAPFLDRAIAAGGVYVTTVEPNQTLELMHIEIDRLKGELIDPRGLDRLVQQFITDYFLKNETNGDQATFLARAQIYHGDYSAASHFVEELRHVRPEDIRRVARTYMHDFRFAYVGKSDALSRSLIDEF